MKTRVRLILALVRTIARIQGAVLWVRRRMGMVKPAPKAERHLILMREGPALRFMGAAFWPDKIIEHYGIVGLPTPREQSAPTIRDNVLERVAELIEDGYCPLEFFAGAATVTFDCEAVPPDLEDFLADRGLGLITGVGSGNVTINLCDPSLAGPLIEAHIAASNSGDQG